MSYADKQCEAEVVESGAANYQRCTREASKISHSGWWMCDAHASPKDLPFGAPEAEGNWERRREYGSGFQKRPQSFGIDDWVIYVPIQY